MLLLPPRAFITVYGAAGKGHFARLTESGERKHRGRKRTEMKANCTETQPNRSGIESIGREIDALAQQTVGELRVRYLV